MSWPGQSFDFGLYKSGKLLVMVSNVGPGGQAIFQLSTNLWFAVVRGNINDGEILTTTQSNFMVNLNDFVNGLVVSLEMNQASGEFTFTAANL